ncbi:flagellar filament capping protein FliD [Ruminococcaceae bacterium OttesenSCG-928-I18]|nr:flagellar filament capping protein FliD [Ruminococcaceae bacterium OttesenSCG-928-I18]
MAINSLSAASRGMAGLVSGINTEEVVQKLLSGTQSKIDKASQRKTTLLYKQQMYREVASKLKTLQTSFMSFTSKTNLLSSSFFNNMTAALKPPTGTSAAFSVTATTSATTGTYRLQQISQLATAYTRKTTEAATGKVDGELNQAVAEKLLDAYRGNGNAADARLVIEVGDKHIQFDNAPEFFGGKSTSFVIDEINKAFETANINASARFVNNKLTITADDPETYITIHGNKSDSAVNKTLAMKMFGEVSSLSGKGTFSATVDTDKYQPSITVNLDGRQQDIYLDLEGISKLATDGDGALLAQRLQESLQQAFGTGVQLHTTSENGKVVGFEFTTGSSNKLTITGNSSNLAALGLKSGISNKLNSSMALKDLNFGIALQGNHHSFTINGVDFSYSADTALSTIINDINASKAGVKITYLEAEDRFTIARSETGFTEETAQNQVINWGQSEGNLLSALFGVESGSDYSGFAVSQTMKADTAVSNANYYNGGNYMFNVNGRDYSFNIPKLPDGHYYSAKTFSEAMNRQFRSNFGTMPDGTQSVEFKLGDDGKFFIQANNKDLVVKTSAYDVDKNPYDLGFSKSASTVVTDGSTKMSDIGIVLGSGNITIQTDASDGSPIVLQGATVADMSMDELANAIQTAMRTKQGNDDVSVVFDKNTAAFRVLGVDVPMEIVINSGSDSENLENLFGSDHVQLKQAAQAGYYVATDGQNAKAIIDGTTIERSSNSFDYNGLTFTLHSEYNKNVANVADMEATEVVIARDTQTIVDGIKEYLKVYNETIDFLNELYKADPTYKDYAPLTEEQKAAMSESEIKAWEEKSKEGLLRNDSNLGRILQALRSSMYTRPEGSSIAIYDLGIDTSYYSNEGNFELTSEDDLKALLEQDPDAVMKLFAGPGGIMELVNNSITEATRSGIANPGYLTREAGANSLDTSSNIYKQISQIDEQMITLENRYWKEYDRYWKQFNSMEQMIQQMNQQSSWLANMFAS